ncbi:maleylpyruvate isomerase family mycothiol-dependent enzyme [Streptomyces sp. NPDC048604]|uniref:maleylpyruvate isomerase family mycothiol-dependent enzyme n=1 Tax=Streptomyces sp. NPDC048604 TaxID=3365578 RepID=UPI00371125B1
MEPILGVAEHLTALDASGRALAAAAAEAGLDAPVPTCPGWQIRDLLRHTTMVHRWAAAFVAEGHTSYRPDGGETRLDGAELLAYFREGHAALVDTLAKAPAELECWTFLPAPSPLAFWARRQAHETQVHCADAESALPGGPRPVDAALAVDGVDELLLAFHGRSRSRVRTESPRVLRVRATDTGDVWTVRLSPDAAPDTARNAEGPADCTLSGPAWRLYLTLWNRLSADAVEVSGDASLAALWREHSGITWS